MKTYILTSEKFSGQVLFTFNDAGVMLSHDASGAQMDAVQLDWLNNRLPHTLNDLKIVLRKTVAAKLTLQQTTGVDFEMFWVKYDEKTRSSKKKALQIWNRLSQTQRDMAYNYMATYERNIPNGIAKKYAETYLRAELWNN